MHTENQTADCLLIIVVSQNKIYRNFLCTLHTYTLLSVYSSTTSRTNHKAFHTTKQYHKPPLPPKVDRGTKTISLKQQNVDAIIMRGRAASSSSHCRHRVLTHVFVSLYNTLNPNSNNKIFNY